jgi:hypothetical protein
LLWLVIAVLNDREDPQALVDVISIMFVAMLPTNLAFIMSLLRFSSLEIDDQLEFGRLLNRQLGRVGTPHDLGNDLASLPPHPRKAWPIWLGLDVPDKLQQLADEVIE